MRKNKEFKVIDDYYEEDEDNLYNVSMQNDYSNVRYEDFSKAKKVEIVIAVILVAYYITKGMFKDLFFYILLLVLSFGLGFGAMAVIDKASE